MNDCVKDIIVTKDDGTFDNRMCLKIDLTAFGNDYDNILNFSNKDLHKLMICNNEYNILKIYDVGLNLFQANSVYI